MFVIFAMLVLCVVFWSFLLPYLYIYTILMYYCFTHLKATAITLFFEHIPWSSFPFHIEASLARNVLHSNRELFWIIWERLGI